MKGLREMADATGIMRTVDVMIDDDIVPCMESKLRHECPWAGSAEGTERFVLDLTDFVLAEEGVDRSTEMSVSFVGTERIHQLNAEFRGIDYATDVLSFPCDNPSEVPEGETVFLGDLIIAPEVVLEQAGDYGHSYEEELSLLVTHGVLHLLGYDHIEDNDAQVMEAREREILAKRGVER